MGKNLRGKEPEMGGKEPVMVTSGCLSTVVILTLSNLVFINKIVFNSDRLSTWLIVGKIGQGMMFCKCNNNSNVLVCVTLVCVTHTLCLSS